jgi:3'-phosphoadenosine 5'-phosphosulfate sulfotransferase (PAPS reductase)/FAD synthetase
MRNEIAALHSKTNLFKRRLEQARRVVSEALQKSNSPYVALSTGKDSTVVYGLVCEQAKNTPAIWSDDEWFLPESLEYVQRLQTTGLDVRQIRTNAWHAEWFQVAGDWDGIPHYARVHNMDLVFLGLRQDENTRRLFHLRKFGPLFFAQSDDFWHCNPIWQWTCCDVWAYIHSTGLDYNRAYDKMEEIGIPLEQQRIGPFAVEGVLGYGQLTILKRGWPDLFNAYAAKYPEARLYV